MPDIIAITTDLIFATRITQTAAAAGRSCDVIRDVAQLQNAIAGARPRLALVDLEASADVALSAIAELKASAPEIRVVAYYSHVRADHAAGAADAGADEVLTRSSFVAKLPSLLAEHA